MFIECFTNKSFFSMKAEFSEQSYAIAQKLAFKFAHGNSSIKYDEYLNVGIDALKKAIENWKENDGRAEFETFATTCIRNAMCTKQKQLNRFDLQQDENIDLSQIDDLMVDMPEGRMVDEVKNLIHKVNKGNVRNAQMVMLKMGLDDAPMDYKEISARFQVSAERVRQVYTSTMATIRADKNASAVLYSFVG